jgi:hypothetical protein
MSVLDPLQTLTCDERLRPDHDLNAIRGNVEQNSNLAPKLVQTLTSAYFRLMRGRRLGCSVTLWGIVAAHQLDKADFECLRQAMRDIDPGNYAILFPIVHRGRAYIHSTGQFRFAESSELPKVLDLAAYASRIHDRSLL